MANLTWIRATLLGLTISQSVLGYEIKEEASMSVWGTIMKLYEDKKAIAQLYAQDSKVQTEREGQLFQQTYRAVVSDRAVLEQLIEEICDSRGVNVPSLILSETVAEVCRRRDKQLLLRLLSSHCPRKLYLHLPIEYQLAANSDGEDFDGFLILCDAYGLSKSHDVRRRIVQILHSAMDGLVDNSLKDDKYVSECVNWYTHNRKEIELNDDYSSILIAPQATRGVALFQRKSSKMKTE